MRPFPRSSSLEWILGRTSTLGSTLFFTGLVIGTAFLLWEYGGLERRIYSSPSRIAESFAEHIGVIAEATWASTIRVGAGILFAGCIGYPLGAFLATFLNVSGVVRSALGFLFAFPKLAVTLFYVFLAGSGRGDMLVPVLWTSGVIGLSLGFLAARRLMEDPASRQYIEAAMDLYCGSRVALYRTQLFPLLLPELVQSLQILSATLWPVLIFVEPTINARASGLGALVFGAVANSYDPHLFFAGAILIALMNVLTWALLALLARTIKKRLFGA